jgi:hypothetical protein
MEARNPGEQRLVVRRAIRSRRCEPNALSIFHQLQLEKGLYITWQPRLAADWEKTSGGRWVVPLGGGIGRIMRLGFQPVNLTLQFYGNAVHPPGASPWGMRMQIAFLFPKEAEEMSGVHCGIRSPNPQNLRLQAVSGNSCCWSNKQLASRVRKRIRATSIQETPFQFRGISGVLIPSFPVCADQD